MNTKNIIGIVVLIVVVAGAVLLLGRHSGTTNTGEQTQVMNGPQSLAALVTAGKPVTCTFSSTTASGTENGIMYVAGGMVAGDFTVTDAQARTLQAHMVVRDQTSYVWTSASPTQGFKSTVNTTTSASGQNQSVGYNAAMNYSCQPWTPDSSKFEIPQNVTFMDVSTYAQPGAGVSAGATGNTQVGTKSAQCGACNQLSGTQKEQCLAALHC